MAHGITEKDTMFSANGIRPWHGLGKVIQDAPNSEEAIKLANLGWDVIQEPAYLQDGTQIPNLWVNIRSDTRDPLGVVRDKYCISQNRESFQFLDNIIQNSKGIECKYETAGSLFGGKKVFMLVRLPETDLVGDKVKNYLFLSNSHDGSSGLMAGITNVRVVCNNTLQMAEQGAQRFWRIRHSKNLLERTKEAEASLGLALTYQERIAQDAERMAAQKINKERFFREFFKKLDVSEKRKEKIMVDIRDLYLEKDDLQNFKGTAWGMYNATADYVSNTRPARVTDKTAEWKMWNFMQGEEMLQIAQKVLAAA